MELLEVLITLPLRKQYRVPAGATGTVSVPTTADTIDENNEDFSIASGTVTGTINDNDAAPTVATITLRLPKEVLLYLNSA
jgi:hypothetical protein